MRQQLSSILLRSFKTKAACDQSMVVHPPLQLKATMLLASKTLTKHVKDAVEQATKILMEHAMQDQQMVKDIVDEALSK